MAGKTNCDEFAMGSSTEHSAYGRTLHPLDKTRVPGGSSGGSAALVAAGVVPAALGSETGGSVRQPASFCGIVGIKPTYARVSRYGLVAFGSSLDQIGVFGRSVHDAGRVLSAISGRDPKDATCEDRDPLRLPTVPAGLQGFVIGAPDVRALYRATRGAGFGAEVRRRILVGTYVLSAGYYDAYYRKAQQVRALLAQDFRNVFDRGVDLLFTPTAPTPAFKAGEKLG